jgi:predicted RNA methylase
MKGHVPTPDALAERMVRRLFSGKPPADGDRILYPGAGTAPFAAAVERLCTDEGWPHPSGVGVELDPDHIEVAKSRDLNHVRFEQRDYSRR